MVVGSEEVLLPGVGSGVVDVTVAALVMMVPFGTAPLTCATTVKFADAAGRSAAMLHVIVAPVVHVNAGPVFCVSETNVVPAGSVSLQLTVVAVEGPLFVTTIV